MRGWVTVAHLWRHRGTTGIRWPSCALPEWPAARVRGCRHARRRLPGVPRRSVWPRSRCRGPPAHRRGRRDRLDRPHPDPPGRGADEQDAGVQQAIEIGVPRSSGDGRPHVLAESTPAEYRRRAARSCRLWPTPGLPDTAQLTAGDMAGRRRRGCPAGGRRRASRTRARRRAGHRRAADHDRRAVDRRRSRGRPMVRRSRRRLGSRRRRGRPAARGRVGARARSTSTRSCAGPSSRNRRLSSSRRSAPGPTRSPASMPKSAASPRPTVRSTCSAPFPTLSRAPVARPASPPASWGCRWSSFSSPAESCSA